MSTFYLVRHGKASPRGDDYDVLSDVGIAQSERLGAHLGRLARRFDTVYLGPLRRHVDTWSAMQRTAREHGLEWPEPTVLDDLAEAPLVDLMRSVLQERLAHDAELQRLVAAMGQSDLPRDDRLKPVLLHMTGLWVGGDVGGEGVETYPVFSARVGRALDTIATAEGRGRSVAVVTSVGVIAELLHHALGAPSTSLAEYVQNIANASVTELVVGEPGFRLGSLSGVEHLEGTDLVTYV